MTFASGDVEGVVHVAIRGDGVVEPDEALSVGLSDPSNAKLGDASAPLTIEDGEPLTFAAGVELGRLSDRRAGRYTWLEQVRRRRASRLDGSRAPNPVMKLVAFAPRRKAVHVREDISRTLTGAPAVVGRAGVPVHRDETTASDEGQASVGA